MVGGCGNYWGSPIGHCPCLAIAQFAKDFASRSFLYLSVLEGNSFTFGPFNDSFFLFVFWYYQSVAQEKSTAQGKEHQKDFFQISLQRRLCCFFLLPIPISPIDIFAFLLLLSILTSPSDIFDFFVVAHSNLSLNCQLLFVASCHLFISAASSILLIPVAFYLSCSCLYLSPITALCSYPLVKMEIGDSRQISTTAPIFSRYNYFRQTIWRLASVQFYFWCIFGD